MRNPIIYGVLILVLILAGLAWYTIPVKNTEPDAGVTYRNTQYGFTFSLPSVWKGYSIVTDSWKGYSLGVSGEIPVEEGAMLSIRNPKWTEANPRQDIPIMIFTIEQWNALNKDEFHIGAAPVGPSELGRNMNYVFALPARYNYAFPAGYEEVDSILADKPLKTF